MEWISREIVGCQLSNVNRILPKLRTRMIKGVALNIFQFSENGFKIFLKLYLVMITSVY